MRQLSLLSGTRTALSIAVLGASALVASTAGATTLPSFNAPGIPAAGFPDFINSNNITLVFTSLNTKDHPNNGYALAAYGSAGAFNLNSSQSYSVNNEVFAMYATFSNSGKFTSGGESIWGNIPRLTSSSFQNLYSTSFDKYAASTSTVGLGFDTVFSSASGWAKKYQTTNESLYLYSAAMASLDKALTTGKNIPSFFTTTVSELTTVPLPATGWLFGTAFAALFGGLRRRRSAAAVLSAASA